MELEPDFKKLQERKAFIDNQILELRDERAKIMLQLWGKNDVVQ